MRQHCFCAGRWWRGDTDSIRICYTTAPVHRSAAYVMQPTHETHPAKMTEIFVLFVSASAERNTITVRRVCVHIGTTSKLRKRKCCVPAERRACTHCVIPIYGVHAGEAGPARPDTKQIQTLPYACGGQLVCRMACTSSDPVSQD